jgi:hypothetical protein
MFIQIGNPREEKKPRETGTRTRGTAARPRVD